MMGDIQEPLRLSFQGDYFCSGSISFGRYETEALCWERRSSFSHNRYLEEVERCSKPGSVTEKKAYFEAHFKRKALLSKITLECQSVVDSQNRIEDENLQNLSNEDNKIEHLNEEIHITSYDKNLPHSVPDQSHITEYGSGCSGCLGADNEQSFDTFSMEDNTVHEEVKIEEVESGCKDGRVHCEPKNDVKEILTGCGEAATFKKSSRPRRIHVNCEGDSATKVKNWSEMILEISELTTPEPSVVKAKRRESGISSKESVTKPVNREYYTSSRSRKEKQIPDSTATMLRSVSGTMKTLASRSPKTKVHENKRFLLAKESTSKSTVNLRLSMSERAGTRSQQTANRHMKSVNSTAPIKNQNISAFSFKSDQHSGRRKESNIKLEEKMLAKGTKAQQVKAKKQETTEADVKQLRKSLNFKATPMPSFYTEARRSLDRSKDVAANYKTSKIQNNPSSPGAGSFKRSLSCQSMRSHEACSTNGYRYNDSIQVSSDNNRIAVSNQAAADKPLISKHVHKEVNNESVLNHRVLENKQVSKGRKIEGVRT